MGNSILVIKENKLQYLTDRTVKLLLLKFICNYAHLAKVTVTATCRSTVTITCSYSYSYC